MNNSIKKREEIKRIVVIGYVITLSFFSFFIFFFSGNFLHIMLLWNIFLAYIPLFISKKLSKKKSASNLLMWLLWIFFIPNAFYMITDFIHIQQIGFIRVDSIYQVTLMKDIVMWLELINIVVCIFTGLFLGAISMGTIHKVIGTKYYVSLLPVLSIAIGFAIFIGRYLRFNSWDIMQPISLLQTLYISMDLFAIQFILLFTILILFINISSFFIKKLLLN